MCVQGNQFFLYQYDDDVIQLEVARFDVALGISVLHYLTPEELAAYKADGLKPLEQRLNDMYENYTAYRVSSHR